MTHPMNERAKKSGTHPNRDRRRRPNRRQRTRRAINIAAASLCLVIVLDGGALLAISLLPKPARVTPQVEVAAPLQDMYRPTPQSAEDARPSDTPEVTGNPEASDTPEASDAPEAATVAPTATLETAPEAQEKPMSGLEKSVYLQTASAGFAYSDPLQNNLIAGTKSYADDRSDGIFMTDEAEIHMGASTEYTQLEGVTTFRGSNYRDGGAYGEIPENPTSMSVVWKKGIRGLDEWTGVGWTGQCSLVRWPADLRAQMNINDEKRNVDGLVEVLYATLDGHIYFLDMADGEPTRDPINVKAPIKGSLAVDPRGVPLLYCGQGIYDVNGKRLECGTRIWSLIDQKLLYFINGSDPVALRGWFAFDCSPLVDGASDTMITCGENGVLYKVALNTRQYTGSVSIDPTVTRYVYKQVRDGKLGTENSLAIYNNYAYFATNIGIIQCVDLNTMELVWCFDAKDDIDASIVIEPEEDGVVGLYATNELDKRGHDGTCQMFKLNALTGELLWVRDSDPIHQNDDNGGGSFATPAVGKHDLEDLVFFHVCRTKETRGMVYALNKDTGETVWSRSLKYYGWSSPTCLYTPAGKGYVLVGSSNGVLHLLDGLTGNEVANVELRGNIEGTPAVFDDMIVVGTRSNAIYGVKIS